VSQQIGPAQLSEAGRQGARRNWCQMRSQGRETARFRGNGADHRQRPFPQGHTFDIETLKTFEQSRAGWADGPAGRCGDIFGPQRVAVSLISFQQLLLNQVSQCRRQGIAADAEVTAIGSKAGTPEQLGHCQDGNAPTMLDQRPRHIDLTVLTAAHARYTFRTIDILFRPNLENPWAKGKTNGNHRVWR